MDMWRVLPVLCSRSSANVCHAWLFSARWNGQPRTHRRCLRLAIATSRTWSRRPRRKCYSEDNRKCPGSVGQASKNSRKLLYSVEWALECGESAVRRGLRPCCELLDDMLLKITAHVLCKCGTALGRIWSTYFIFASQSENKTQTHSLRKRNDAKGCFDWLLQSRSIIHPYIWCSSDPLLPVA